MLNLTKKISPFFCLVMIISFLSMVLIISPNMEVQALGYYNWIKNSGFEPYSNWIEDGGAESNDWLSGIKYGNFTNIDAQIQSVVVYSGTYAFYNVYSTAPEFEYWFDVSYQPLTDDIENFTVWVCPDNDPAPVGRITIYYVEGGSDMNVFSLGTTQDVWSLVYFDQATFYDLGKHIEYFEVVSHASGINFASDNWQMLIDDGAYSQTDISTNTYPWWGNENNYNLGLNEINGHESSYSGYFGYLDADSALVQDINYLDTEDFSYIDLWGYTSAFPDGNTDCGVQVVIVYSDRTSDSHIETITLNNTWTLLSFGSAWVDSNKYIVQLQIRLENTTYMQYVNFDDVGLWSTENIDVNVFEYDLSPNTYINEENILSWEAYTLHDYTFTGYVYDENDTLTEDGSFQVTHELGTQSGIITDGIFSFTVYERSSVYDFSEDFEFTITITTPSSRNMYTQIQAYWVATTGDTGQGSTPDVDDSEVVSDFMLLFILLFVPPMILAMTIGAKSGNASLGVVGFIGGLLLTTSIGVQTGLIDIWVVFVNLVIMVIMGLVTVKGGI